MLSQLIDATNKFSAPLAQFFLSELLFIEGNQLLNCTPAGFQVLSNIQNLAYRNRRARQRFQRAALSVLDPPRYFNLALSG